jgi:hypothetical protein
MLGRNYFALLGWLVMGGAASATPSEATEKAGLSRDVLIVVGAGGEAEYQAAFESWGQRWQAIFDQEGTRVRVIGSGRPSVAGQVTPNRPSADRSPVPVSDPAKESVSPSTDSSEDRDELRRWLEERPKVDERWLILLGHGTYQKKVAKFNLRGADIAADELARSMEKNATPWRVVICASSSSPFIHALSGKDRILITATKSGSEQNYSRFGDYLSQSLADERADLDHDGGLTLLEVFLHASAQLALWYDAEGRLPSEQALLDDNGDQRGTPAVFFRGTRAVRSPASDLEVDGRSANQCYLRLPRLPSGWDRQQQTEVAALEAKIEALRARKGELSEDEYFNSLEQLLLELARYMLPAEEPSS